MKSQRYKSQNTPKKLLTTKRKIMETNKTNKERFDELIEARKNGTIRGFDYEQLKFLGKEDFNALARAFPLEAYTYGTYIDC